jgi:hypothetical protein
MQRQGMISKRSKPGIGGAAWIAHRSLLSASEERQRDKRAVSIHPPIAERYAAVNSGIG